MSKMKSRSARWFAAVSAAQEAFEKYADIDAQLQEALNDLREVQQEYEEWRDNLPENFQQSALGEKLDAVVDYLDIPDDPASADRGDIENLIGEAEAIDLPLGFGRD